MAGYISGSGIEKAKAARLPSEMELQKALQTLSNPPAPLYQGFTLDEVRAIGAYRIGVAKRIPDGIWKAITDGKPEAWLYAVHEAAEVEDLIQQGIEPFSVNTRSRAFSQAHLKACGVELAFLLAWANHLGYNTSELALELRNPIRRVFPNHYQFVLQLQRETGWSIPSAAEEQTAEDFYRRILP